MKTRLRELTDADSELLLRWINTRELVILSAPFKVVHREEHDKWFASVRKADDHRIYAIALVPEDRTIGYCQLKRIDRVSSNAELQIRIGEPGMLSRGAGTASVLELLAIAFEQLRLHRVYLHVLASNTRARRTYAKCGFVEEGVQREAVRVAEAYEDVVMMGILARDWAASA